VTSLTYFFVLLVIALEMQTWADQKLRVVGLSKNPRIPPAHQGPSFLVSTPHNSHISHKVIYLLHCKGLRTSRDCRYIGCVFRDGYAYDFVCLLVGPKDELQTAFGFHNSCFEGISDVLAGGNRAEQFLE
jgi:hypothetical protein